MVCKVSKEGEETMMVTSEPVLFIGGPKDLQFMHVEELRPRFRVLKYVEPGLLAPRPVKCSLFRKIWNWVCRKHVTGPLLITTEQCVYRLEKYGIRIDGRTTHRYAYIYEDVDPSSKRVVETVIDLYGLRK